MVSTFSIEVKNAQIGILVWPSPGTLQRKHSKTVVAI